MKPTNHQTKDNYHKTNGNGNNTCLPCFIFFLSKKQYCKVQNDSGNIRSDSTGKSQCFYTSSCQRSRKLVLEECAEQIIKKGLSVWKVEIGPRREEGPALYGWFFFAKSWRSAACGGCSTQPFSIIRFAPSSE